MKTKEQTVYEFLQSCAGNWRSCIAIHCECCPYGQRPCQGFLLTADVDGKPIVVEAITLSKALGQSVEIEECIAALERQAFEAVFSRWLLWQVNDPRDCPLKQLTL